MTLHLEHKIWERERAVTAATRHRWSNHGF